VEIDAWNQRFNVQVVVKIQRQTSIGRALRHCLGNAWVWLVCFTYTRLSQVNFFVIDFERLKTKQKSRFNSTLWKK
tara:strand:+ start:236 stop:463 length:228 start_codon:yes stop_codon:yes gene_type:complete